MPDKNLSAEDQEVKRGEQGNPKEEDEEKSRGAERKFFGLGNNIFFVGLTSFLMDTTTKMIYAIMPMFLLSLGASKTELSLIEGIAESTASVLKALSGWWSDRIGRNKPFMIIGYAFTALLSPLFAFVTTPLQVLIVRFTERVGKGIRTAPRDSLIAGSSADNAKGKSFGFHKAMDNSGAILGPLLATGILLLFPSDYRKVFLFAAIPSLLGLFSIIFFVKEAKKEKTELLGKISLRDFSPKYYAFLGIVFIFTLGNSTNALLLIKASDIGVPDAWIPMIFLLFNAVAVIFSIPAGIMSDKIGREKLIIFGYLLYSLIYFGFGKTHSIVVLVLLFSLYGLYSAATDGIQKALVSDLIDKNKRGTGLGLYNCLIGVTLLPASLIAGLLYDHVNNSAPFYFGAIMALLATVLMLIFYWRGTQLNIRN
ncbi:MAG: MFS transporter [Desulfitobacterium sp.]